MIPTPENPIRPSEGLWTEEKEGEEVEIIYIWHNELEKKEQARRIVYFLKTLNTPPIIDNRSLLLILCSLVVLEVLWKEGLEMNYVVPLSSRP